MAFTDAASSTEPSGGASIELYNLIRKYIDTRDVAEKVLIKSNGTESRSRESCNLVAG